MKVLEFYYTIGSSVILIVVLVYQNQRDIKELAVTEPLNEYASNESVYSYFAGSVYKL